MTSQIIIKNKKICDFYKKNSQLDCEAINLVFIDLIEKLSSELNTNLHFSINSQILSGITEMNSSIISIKDTINTINNDITKNMEIKFHEIKKDYLSELRLILNDNANEKFGYMLDKNNSLLIDKMDTIINDIVPKSQGQYYSQIQDYLRSFHKSISDDTRILLKYADNNSIKDYVNNFEIKSSMMMQNIQQPIYSFISASEDRINNNISGLKDNTVQTKLLTELTDLIQTIKKDSSEFSRPTSPTSICGGVGGLNSMNFLLNKLYSTAEIVSANKFQSKSETGSNNNSNSYIIKRHGRQKIMVQSIDAENNINQDEIRDFVQNMEENNCHGIFLSHNSGFTTKQNYQIETHNKLTMIYVHDAQYSTDKIKTAVDIIDNLFAKMKELNIDSSFEVTIDKDMLEEINKEYQYFISQKEIMTNIIKETQKKMMNQLDEFKFPGLDKYLSTKFAAVTRKTGLKCDLCKNFNAHNLKALAAHKRGCQRKQPSAVVCQPVV